MSEPFLSQIKPFGFNFAPRSWAKCDGQTLPINQNQSLYSLLGTNYGGDGRTTFGLPDLRGRSAMHQGQGAGLSRRRLGEKIGDETVTLTVNEMPSHGHVMHCSSTGTTNRVPTDGYPAKAEGFPTEVNVYKDTQDTTFNAGAIANTGGGQAHNNMQPFLVVNFCIALQGLFPSRN